MRRTRAELASALASLLMAVSAGRAQEGAAASAPAPQPAAASRPATAATPRPEDGPAYPVSEFVLRYVHDNPAHPSIQTLMNLSIELGWTSQGYVAARADVPTVRISLAESSMRGTETYFASALQRILERIRDELTGRQMIGVFVAPDPAQIDEAGKDARQPQTSQNPLTILITTGNVTELRTLASGERVSPKGPIKPEDRINNPVHQRIRDRSPIQPYHEGDPVQRDLLRKDLLDEYLFFLSRHPGRRVDASVAAAEEPGGVALDYLVTENRPLSVYAQASNTGTQSTGYMRERFGFFDTQLTNNDDTLSFDFITNSFDATNAVLGAYEAPFSNDRIRWRIDGNWQQFKADQVGFFHDTFEGDSWALGGSIITNIYQKRELFIDFVVGGRFENIHVDDKPFAIEGDDDFIIPTIALRLDRTTEWFSTQGAAGLEWWLSDATSEELSALGRTDPSTDPTVFQGSLVHSVFLEPLLDRKAWENPETHPTLAHEVLASVRGQYAFGYRLIPQAEQVVGGLYSVRGYPESAVAGDSAIIGSIEYRFHLPRAFEIESEPRQLLGHPFRLAPQYSYGRPDWDLILKTFLDAGRTFNSDRLSFEQDNTLVGTGVGLEFLFKRNFNLRMDWGFALESIESVPVHAGSNRLQFVATILF